VNPPIVITHVTASHVAALLETLANDKGTRVTPSLAAANVHDIVGHGIDAKATYSPSTQTLSVEIVSKPWIVTIGEIKSKLTAALGA
jgi:hypothetical protein